MATKGFIDTQINNLPVNIRYPLKNAFYYMMDNWRFGKDRRAENAQLYRVTSTTATTANTEFTVPHGIGMAPTQLLPILDLSKVGSQLVPLTVSRAADSQNVYLTSSSTGAVFTVLLEV